MTLTVEVTPQDLRNGVRDSWRSGPISLAIRRVFPDSREVRVMQGRVDVLTAPEPLIGILPHHVREWADRFDRRAGLLPIPPPPFAMAFRPPGRAMAKARGGAA